MATASSMHTRFRLVVVCGPFQVLGHSKTVLVLLTSWALLGEPMALRKVLGMGLAMAGMMAYGSLTSSAAAKGGSKAAKGGSKAAAREEAAGQEPVVAAAAPAGRAAKVASEQDMGDRVAGAGGARVLRSRPVGRHA